MKISRRRFWGRAGAVTLGFMGLRLFWDNDTFSQASRSQAPPSRSGYGALLPDPEGILNLPEGFRYHVFSRTGDRMDDGLYVPGAHDGMAAFPAPDGSVILVRNHELSEEDRLESWYGAAGVVPDGFDRSRFYDPAALGGVTTLIYDVRASSLVRHYASLAGTAVNCAGGPTPWNTWITCEETLQRADEFHMKDHGYNFEVAAAATGLVQPVALTAMGRFNHEAIAVDEASGVVYQTEDRNDGLFYRFIPSQPGNLAAGGRLQALQIQGMESVDTSNNAAPVIALRRRMPVSWVDMEDVEAPEDGLRAQGAIKGAAQFARGEGMWTGRDGVYFACTLGGPAECGQIWRYIPSPYEGTAAEAGRPGMLELFAESGSALALQNADNITVAPWGDIIICEDGEGQNRIVGVTPEGEFYTLAANAMNDSEFAGGVFSPDGGTMFVNIQRPGMTLAITGPWKGWAG